ncbi:hypothetical protein HNR60_000135 [Rhodopseudomonas rhenobacensis]|uniref:Uncharacterized protein n=1 Tax=Rhodopseudomonas rhenobacensis TaxID=87461 RepID=A0A7W7Z001_9BRAD|nr:hypothetical protein [Rhodopseudomonas rhenobacensis]
MLALASGRASSAPLIDAARNGQHDQPAQLGSGGKKRTAVRWQVILVTSWLQVILVKWERPFRSLPFGSRWLKLTVCQALDLVFEMELLPLELHDLQIVERLMFQCLFELLFEGMMSSIQFRKAGLCRHLGFSRFLVSAFDALLRIYLSRVFRALFDLGHMPGTSPGTTTGEPRPAPPPGVVTAGVRVPLRADRRSRRCGPNRAAVQGPELHGSVRVVGPYRFLWVV